MGGVEPSESDGRRRLPASKRRGPPEGSEVNQMLPRWRSCPMAPICRDHSYPPFRQRRSHCFDS